MKLTLAELRTCMFCGASLANRHEAYYDHLRTNGACQEAWKVWKEQLDHDRPAGG